MAPKLKIRKNSNMLRFPALAASRKMYRICVMLALLGIIFAVTNNANSGATVSAFTPTNVPHFARFKDKSIQQQPLSRLQKCPNLQMSSLGQDEDTNNTERNINFRFQNLLSWIQSKFPNPPEDQLSMTGDITAIFIYSFLDHSLNELFDNMVNSPDVLASSAKAFIASSTTTSNLVGAEGTIGLPVWFDTLTSAPFGSIPLSAALPLVHHVKYAPAISTAGLASVLLTSSWLLCGYFTGAFLFENTLDCKTSHAISVTGKTWVFACLIMVMLAWGSDTVVGCVDCLHKSVGLTKADADYIFDSLSVLLMWRFVYSSMLGYGDDDSSSGSDK